MAAAQLGQLAWLELYYPRAAIQLDPTRLGSTQLSLAQLSSSLFYETWRAGKWVQWESASHELESTWTRLRSARARSCEPDSISLFFMLSIPPRPASKSKPQTHQILALRADCCLESLFKATSISWALDQVLSCELNVAFRCLSKIHFAFPSSIQIQDLDSCRVFEGFGARPILRDSRLSKGSNSLPGWLLVCCEFLASVELRNYSLRSSRGPESWNLARSCNYLM